MEEQDGEVTLEVTMEEALLAYQLLSRFEDEGMEDPDEEEVLKSFMVKLSLSLRGGKT